MCDCVAVRSVTCMDLNVAASLDAVRTNDPDWAAWYQENVVQGGQACPALSLSHEQLEALRSPSVIPGAQKCGADYSHIAANFIDECATGADTCDANAACTNTAGSYTCACDSGYTEAGVHEWAGSRGRDVSAAC